MKLFLFSSLFLFSLIGFSSDHLPDDIRSYIERHEGVYLGKFAHEETFGTGFPIFWDRRKAVTKGEISLRVMSGIPVLEFSAEDGGTDLFGGKCKSSIGKFLKYKNVRLTKRYDFIFEFDHGTCVRDVGREVTVSFKNNTLEVNIYSSSAWETRGTGNHEIDVLVDYFWLGKFALNSADSH